MTNVLDSARRAGLPRRTLLASALGGAAALAVGCSSGSGVAAPATSNTPGRPTGSPSDASQTAPTASGRPSAVATGLAAQLKRANVPVLCWHQVREPRASDSKNSRYELVISPQNFAAQLDAIKNAGWTTISPKQYHDHIATGAELPPKPVLLTFDDGSDNQAQVALPMVLKRGMTAAWFIMTVVIDAKTWATASEIGDLARAGITIGSHTWDHHTLDKLTTADDFETQFVGSRKTLQKITGQDVTDFCYPGGHWTKAALPHLAAAGYTAGYQLKDTPVDPAAPLMTLRRQIVVSEWSGAQIVSQLDALAA